MSPGKRRFWIPFLCLAHVDAFTMSGRRVGLDDDDVGSIPVTDQFLLAVAMRPEFLADHFRIDGRTPVDTAAVLLDFNDFLEPSGGAGNVSHPRSGIFQSGA